MTSMYSGGYRRHSDDLNRRRRQDTLPADGDWPRALKAGFYLCAAGAVLLLISGFVMLSGYRGDPAADQAYIDAVVSNQRIVGVVNVAAGILVAMLAAQLRGGGRMSRRWLGGVVALAMFVNIAAFVIQVVGPASIVIVVVLAFAMLFVFRPASNLYIRTKWAERR